MCCKLSSSMKTLQASGFTASKIASMRCPRQLAIFVSIMMALEKLRSLMWSILFCSKSEVLVVRSAVGSCAMLALWVLMSCGCGGGRGEER